MLTFYIAIAVECATRICEHVQRIIFTRHIQLMLRRFPIYFLHLVVADCNSDQLSWIMDLLMADPDIYVR